METYVVLMEMTEYGLENIHKIPSFVKSLEKKLEKKNVKLEGFYKVMGEVDYVTIIKSENDVNALGAVMALGKIKYFNTLTSKAYTMDEMAKSLDIYTKDLS